jgi:hypothetical protein
MESCEPGPSSTESYEHLPCVSSGLHSAFVGACITVGLEVEGALAMRLVPADGRR